MRLSATRIIGNGSKYLLWRLQSLSLLNYRYFTTLERYGQGAEKLGLLYLLDDLA